MSYLVWLVPIALGMGIVGLIAFLWSMHSGQLEDLDGAAERVLLSDAADRPLPTQGQPGQHHLAGSGTPRPAGRLQAADNERSGS